MGHASRITHHAYPIGRPTGDPIDLDDFTGILDAGAAARESAPGKWHLQKNCWGARKGELLVAGAETNAPTISFSPDVSGHHSIFIGAYSPGNRGGFVSTNYGVYVRLDGEPHFTFLQVERAEPSFQEMFFKTTDLTGRSIEICNFEKSSSLDYIKLVPVEPRPLPAATGKLIGILDFADVAV